MDIATFERRSLFLTREERLEEAQQDRTGDRRPDRAEAVDESFDARVGPVRGMATTTAALAVAAFATAVQIILRGSGT